MTDDRYEVRIDGVVIDTSDYGLVAQSIAIRAKERIREAEGRVPTVRIVDRRRGTEVAI